MGSLSHTFGECLIAFSHTIFLSLENPMTTNECLKTCAYVTSRLTLRRPESW